MIRVYLFLAVFLFNAYKGLFLSSSIDTYIRVGTVVSDLLIIGLAFMRLPKSSSFYGTRAFFFLSLSSILIILVNLDRTPLTVQLSGLREPLFFLACLVLVFDILNTEHAHRFKQYFTFLLLLFCLSQSPFSVRQFLEFGLGDAVGGTLGFGGPNAVTLMLFMAVFYLIVVFGSSDQADEFSTGKVILWSLLLLPVFINESKIALVFLPVFFGLLTFTRRVYKIIPIGLLAIALVFAFDVLYKEYMERSPLENVLDERFLEKYLVDRSDLTAGADLPRGRKLSLTIEMMSAEPLTFLLGFGYGSLGERTLLTTSAFSRSIWWMRGSKVLLNTALFQGGVLLVICLAWPMFVFIRSRLTISRNMKRFRLFLFFVLGVMWFYHDSMLPTRVFGMVVAYLVVWTDLGGVDQQPPESMGEPTEGEARS